MKALISCLLALSFISCGSNKKNKENNPNIIEQEEFNLNDSDRRWSILSATCGNKAVDIKEFDSLKIGFDSDYVILYNLSDYYDAFDQCKSATVYSRNISTLEQDESTNKYIEYSTLTPLAKKIQCEEPDILEQIIDIDSYNQILMIIKKQGSFKNLLYMSLNGHEACEQTLELTIVGSI